MLIQFHIIFQFWVGLVLQTWGVVYTMEFNFPNPCLLYTSDAADDLLCVDLGGRRIIKKKNITKYIYMYYQPQLQSKQITL